MVDAALQHILRDVRECLDGAQRRTAFQVRVHEEGRVLQVRDSVARIGGLRDAGLDELLYVGDHELGLVLGLEPDTVQAVLLGAPGSVRAGARVRSSGREVSLAVGESLLGRVVDALGRPLDGRPLTAASSQLSRVSHQRAAPQIFERAAIRRPLLTGVLAIDAMFPIGRGQRELIVGDEGTGKTALALDVVLRQRDTDVVSVYVAIGCRRSEVARIARALEASGGAYVIVAAPEDASVGLRYLAPYAGCAIGEYFMDRGRDALVVYDDLTAHAVAFRELSLLLRRPPGREAFPGDIFYQHSRLLERATQLSAERGGGSLTALPIARLESGRLSAYIPTNLISITDGQIVMSQPLFAAGQKPAIDAGLSVSRVGGKAQPQAIAAVARRLRLEFAAFLELEQFARLGTHLDSAADRRLRWGRKLRALLRAPRMRPLSLFDEVARLALAAERSLIEAISESQLPVAVDQLCARLRSELAELVHRVERGAVLPDGDRRSLLAAIQRFVAEHPELNEEPDAHV